jgi:hypothetical protein
MTDPQLQIFTLNTTLADATTLEQRLAGVEAVIASEPGLSKEQRMELLCLAVWPGAFSEGAES